MELKFKVQEDNNKTYSYFKKWYYTIYLDMDSVLTDFRKHFEDHFDIKLEWGNKQLSDDEIFVKIESVPHWWLTMPWMKHGKELLEKCRFYAGDVLLLTTPAHSVTTCEEDKENWAKREIGNIDVIFSESKEDYADKNVILIDDRKGNIKRFNDAGGIGILYDNYENVIKKLEKIFY